MSPYMENHIILDSNSLEATSICKNKIVTEILHIKNGKDLISYFDNNCDKDWDRILNISIPISAAVTAFARIHKSQFKNRDDFTLFYTDTDSIDINKPLDPKFIGKELGKMKLEHIFEKILFLAPKVYSGITSSKKITKIKGYKSKDKFKEKKKNNIELEKLLPLLNKNEKLELHQDKWHRYFSKGYIEIKDEIYTLIVTDNKRKIIYDNNNKFIDTKPINIYNEEIID
jgi:hypothetical protein